jgi:hypothetical protein
LEKPKQPCSRFLPHRVIVSRLPQLKCFRRLKEKP